MIKILFVHQNLEIGGVSKVRYLLLKYLDKKRYDAEVCSIGPKGEIGELIEQLGYKVYAFNEKINLFNPIIFFKLYKLVKKGKYNIIQSALFYANYYSRIVGFIARVKIILTEEHGIYLWKSKHKIFIVIDRFLSRITTKIICCSETVRRFTSFQEKIKMDKIITIHNFIDSFNIDSLWDKKAIKRQFNLSEGLFLIGIIGTLRTEKGHRCLFRALTELDFSDYNLVLVGDGYLERELKEDAIYYGIADKIIFLGKTNRIPEIMKALDVIVIPSQREGLPMVLLEAMASSLPVIASRVSGLKEVIVNNENGILIPKGNTHKLAEALTYLKNNPDISYRLGKTAMEICKRKYSKDVYLNKLEALYKLAYN